MATTTEVFPPVFLPDGEENNHLRKYKESGLKRWRLTRARHLQEIGDLALSLIALNRFEEAIAVCDFPTSRVQFDGKFNIWDFVEVCFALRFCALSRLGRFAEAHTPVQPISGRRSVIRLDIPASAIEDATKDLSSFKAGTLDYPKSLTLMTFLAHGSHLATSLCHAQVPIPGNRTVPA